MSTCHRRSESLPGPTQDRRFLPGEHPHVDDALMNHLIPKCVRRRWRRIACLKERMMGDVKNRDRDLDRIKESYAESTWPAGTRPIRTPIPVTGTPGFSTSRCLKR